MNRDDAKDLLDLFFRRTKSGLLTDTQRSAVVSTIMRTYDDASEVTISDIRRLVRKKLRHQRRGRKPCQRIQHHRLPPKRIQSES